MSGADVLVVGAGHDGLAAAAHLAGQGRSVVVLEARDAPGGVAAGMEIHPGHRAPSLWPGADRPAPFVAAELDLAAHGLALRTAPPVLLAGADSSLLLHGDPGPAEPALAARAAALPGRYAGYHAFLGQVRALGGPLLERRPPALDPRGPGELLEHLRLGLAARRLGPGTLEEVVRAVPMAAADLAREWFDDEVLAAGVAAAGLAGLVVGPWSPGTAAALILRELAGNLVAVGGAAGLTSALVAAAENAGAELSLSSPVETLLVEGGAVRGARLASGVELRAEAVLSTADPRSTLLDLVPPGVLEQRLEHAARTMRAQGTTAAVLLALDGPLEAATHPGERIEALRIVGSLDDLERAADRLKYRELVLEAGAPGCPWAEVWVPTWSSPELAPPAQHVAVVHLQPVCGDPAGGWTAERREAAGDLAIQLLEGVAPGIAARVVGRQVLPPPDIGERLSRPGGHLHQLEVTLDQLFLLRPTRACARYGTPLPGLFIGGSGSHPGPHARGAAGLLAARALAGA